MTGALVINVNTKVLIIALKSLDQPKNDPSKHKRVIIGQKSGPAKTIFGQ